MRVTTGKPLRNVDDLVLVPIDKGCGDCRYRRSGLHDECSAHGTYCRSVRVELRGEPCPYWSRASYAYLAFRFVLKWWWVPTIIVGIVAAIYFTASSVSQCRDAELSWGATRCSHPDQTLSTEDGHVFCRCPHKQEPHR